MCCDALARTLSSAAWNTTRVASCRAPFLSRCAARRPTAITTSSKRSRVVPLRSSRIPRPPMTRRPMDRSRLHWPKSRMAVARSQPSPQMSLPILSEKSNSAVSPARMARRPPHICWSSCSALPVAPPRWSAQSSTASPMRCVRRRTPRRSPATSSHFWPRAWIAVSPKR